MKRRGVALLGLAMVAAGLIWAAVAMAGTTIQVDGAKGPTDVVINPDNSDIKGELYNLPDGRKRITGWSLQKVLNQAHVGADGWTRIFLPDGVVVGRDEVFSGKRLPVFALPQNGDDIYFIRPKKGDQPAEFARANTLSMDYRVPIEITPELDKPDAGETIKFSADAPGPDSAYKFEWDANGTTGTGSTFEYTIPSSGRVVINVEGERNGQTLAEQTVSTPVKEAPPEDNGGTGGTGGIGTGSSYGSDYNYDSGYTPPSDFGGDYDSSTPNPEQNFPDPPKETPEDTTLPEATSGTSVSGELLAAVAPLEPSSGGDAAAASDAEEATTPEDEVIFEENEEVTAPGALIAAGVVIGIIGLGAGPRNRRCSPTPLPPAPEFQRAS